MAFAIRGSVLSQSTGSPMSGIIVEVSSAFGAAHEWTAQTDPGGDFSIPLTAEEVDGLFSTRRHRELFFAIYTPVFTTIGATTPDFKYFLGCQISFVSKATVNGVDAVELTVEPVSLISGPGVSVSGYVVDADGTPRDGIDVTAYATNLRSETSLGTATTGVDGRFLIRYR